MDSGSLLEVSSEPASPLLDCPYSSLRIELDSNGSYPADDRGVEIQEAAGDGGK
jgi:hypothetical protein